MWNETNQPRNNNAKRSFQKIQKYNQLLKLSKQLQELIVPKVLQESNSKLIQELKENFDVIKAGDSIEQFGVLVQLLNCKKPQLQRYTVEVIRVILD